MADIGGATPAPPIFGTIAIIGIGLIGSSIAWATRRSGGAARIVAYDASPEVRARVRQLGMAHHVAEDAAEAVLQADHVVLCVPVGAYGAVAAGIAPHLKPGAIVSDVGSVKASVVEAVSPHLPEGTFLVPAHPVAGTEFSGPTPASPRCSTTAGASSRPATGRARRRWSACAASGSVSAPRSTP